MSKKIAQHTGGDWFLQESMSDHEGKYIMGTDANGGDNTVFLDNVQLALAPSLVPPKLGCAVVNGEIQMSWPPDHAGWSLQMQTNPLNQGLGTNWLTLPGTNLTNQYVSPITLAGGSVFYRLIYP